MKKGILLLLACIMVFTLAACGGGNNNGGNNASGNTSNGANAGTNSEKEPEAVTLRMAWWGGEPRHEYTLKVIEMYQEAYPHVKIEPEYANWDDYWKKLAPQAAANELPDIIQMDLSYLTQYGEKGQLEDLTPYLNKQIDISDISDSAVSGGKLGDALYGFNLGVNALQVHYDPELLKKAGVDGLPDNWTWDDYEEIAMKVKDAGLYFDTGLRPEVFFAYYLRQNDKTLYAADGTQIGYEDDQLFIDFFSRVQRLAKEGATPAPDLLAQIKGIEDDLMVKQQAASIWQWTNQYVGVRQVANRPLAMHPLPGPNADKGLFLKPSMFFSVSKNSKQKEEAAKFIDFFVNNVEANKLIMGDRGVPVAGAVKEALKPLLTPEQVEVFDFVSWAEDNSSVMDPPDPIGAAEVMALMKDLDDRIKFQQITVEEAAQKFREEANMILGRNK